MTLQGTPVLILKDDAQRTTGKDAIDQELGQKMENQERILQDTVLNNW